MNKKATIPILGFLVLFFAGEGLAQKAGLPPVHKKWLEEEVVYIITPLEREVFLKLTTDRERDIFIEAFWKHRDPTPQSPENEFKTEHYRRISYANHFFGRSGPKAGWKTERGRIYIILGEPIDIQRFEGKSTIYPTEIWFYQGKTELGLPAAFNIVFFQPGGVGEHRLYSPIKDGPQALMTTYEGDPIDYQGAYEQLRELEPQVADVSLSLIPGEEGVSFGRPSLSSDILLQKVETVPERQVEEKYAQKFLQYKDIVEVDYTANYMDSESLVKVFKDASGLDFVHLAIEPKRLSVAQYENKYYTTFQVNGTVWNKDGKVIYQFDRKISLDFDEEKMAAVSRQPLSIHDMFPFIPGNYKFSLLVKNEVSKEFTSLEQNLVIPEPTTSPQMSALLLGYRISKAESRPKNLKPFRIGPYQIYFQPNRVFLKKDSLAVAFQLHHLSPEAREQGEARFTIFRDEASFRTWTRNLRDYASLPDAVEELSLAEFPPAHYKIGVSLLLSGQELASAADEFDVTHVEGIPRPWIYSKLLPDSQDAVYDSLIGLQLFNSGRISEAQVYQERAYQKSSSADGAFQLAQTYMALSEYQKIEPLLTPFVSQPQPPKYEVLFLLGQAFLKMGEFRKAISIFDRAISHYGINSNLLNAIGRCHFELEEIEEAAAAWRKSLEISPDQPQIKKILETLKEKK